MDPFVAQLAGLCAAQRTRVKWVFVPTHALGRTWANASRSATDVGQLSPV
jgi:hypothetical protein